MSKRLSADEKLCALGTMCKSFTREQVEHLERIDNVDARYKCAQRYMRELNEGMRGERVKAWEYYKKYAVLLEGFDCIDNKLWTDEKKIKAFSSLLDDYCDKCVKLVEYNDRRHLERLKLERQQKQKEYEERQAKYDMEIARLEAKLR